MITQDLKEIPIKEVQLHDTYSDIWIILFNRVYDITTFLQEVRFFFRFTVEVDWGEGVGSNEKTQK